jgi:amino acid transporter
MTRSTKGLRRDALGLPALTFSVATAAAPMAALLFNVPVIVFGAGWAAPAAFLVAAAMLAVFSIGYVAMSRRVTSAGGFYSFVSHGLGRAAGLGVAGVVTLSYTVLCAAIVGAFAYFGSVTVEDWTGLNIPVWALLFGALAANVVFMLFEVRITARVLGAFFLAEVLALVVFAVVVLAQGGESGLSAAPLNPLQLVDNESAIAVFGAAAPGIALFGAFWSWVGFEMAPNYGEETRRRIGRMPVLGAAMGVTLLALTVVYVLVSYAFVIGYGTDGAAAGVGAQFEGQVASAFFPLTDGFGGGWLTTAFQAVIVTSAFACQLDDSSRDAALLKLATWSPLLGVFGLLAVQAVTSLAIVAYFRRHRGGNPWTTLVAPIAGAALMAFSAFLLLANRGTLAAAEGVPFVEAIPYVVVAVFVLGAAGALWLRLRGSTSYEALGRIVIDEA